jgi:hypothetical protein
LRARRRLSAITGGIALTALLLTSNRVYARDRDGNGRDDGTGRLMLALDLDYAVPLADDFIKWGGGGTIRIGSEVDLVGFTVTPELNFALIDFIALSHSN